MSKDISKIEGLKMEVKNSKVPGDANRMYIDVFIGHHNKLSSLMEKLLQADDTNAMGLIEQAPQVLQAFRGDAKQWKKVQSAFP